MSFVLEALKRSERDRHQGQIPDLASDSGLMHLTKPKRVIWPYVLIVVLALNAGVFVYIFASNQDQYTVDPQPSDLKDELGRAELSSEQVNETSLVRELPRTEELERRSNFDERQQLASDRTNTPVSLSLPQEPGLDDAEYANSENSPSIDWEKKKAESQALITQNLKISEEIAYSSNVDLSLDDKPVIISPNQAPRIYDDPIIGRALESYDSQGYDVIAPKEGERRVAPELSSTDSYSEDFNVSVSAVDTKSSRIDDAPFLYEMDGYERPRVPSLTFNSHIYSDNPSARRVMINNIYLREGQSFNGIDVVEIGEQNILFSKDSVTFKLPAMRDWDG